MTSTVKCSSGPFCSEFSFYSSGPQAEKAGRSHLYSSVSKSEISDPGPRNNDAPSCRVKDSSHRDPPKDFRSKAFAKSVAGREDGHPDLPRDKLFLLGPQALSDTELVAVFLGSGIKGAGVMKIANSVLSAYGSLSCLLQTSQSRLCTIRGVGKTRYAQLSAIMELSRRAVLQEMRHNDVLSSPGKVREYLSSRLSG